MYISVAVEYVLSTFVPIYEESLTSWHNLKIIHTIAAAL